MLVVTPAALASPVVRAEYLMALSSAIPVIVLLLRPVPQLPTEVRNAPVIDWTRRKWRGEQQLFVALYDLGIRSSEDRTVLGSQWVGNVVLANAGRAPHTWKRITVARSRYLALLVGYAVASLSVLSLLLAESLAGNALVRPGSVFVSSFAWEMLLMAAPIIVVLALMFSLLMLMINLTAFLAYFFEWWPPEAVVITETGVTVNLFRLRWGRAGVVPAHFPFAAISLLSVHSSPFGRTSLVMKGAGGAIETQLPARLRWPSAATTEIVETWRSYVQRQTEESVKPAPALALLASKHTTGAAPDVRQLTAPLAPLAPRYVVVAGTEDRMLLASIGGELMWRGITQAECVEALPESLILPSAAGARVAGVALVVLSPRVVHSPRLEPIVRDLTSRGVLVIPLIVEQRLPKPLVVASLQWMDFSAQSEFRLGVADLLNALDASGVPLAAPSGAVDGELILARASHRRSRPDWHVFETFAQTRTVYRLLEHFRAGGILGVLGGWIGRNRRKSAYSQLLSNRTLPEMVVVTPQAVVVHVVNVRNSRFDDYALPLNAIQRIERRWAYHTPIRLRATLHNGQVVEFGLPGSLGEVDLVAATIEQQWHAARDQAVVPEIPSPGTS